MSSPWDINTALSQVTPGTTVQLLAGTYNIATRIDISIVGTAAQPITLQGNNGQAILNWIGPTDTGQDADIMQLTLFEIGPPYEMYWVIDGLKFQNAGRSGLRLSWVNYVTVKNSESGPNGVWGMFTDFSNYLVFDNINCHNSGSQHGIYISNSCGNEILQNSQFHDNAGAGIHHNGDASSGPGQPGYTQGIIINSTIRNNVIWNNGALGGAGINMDGVISSQIYNNVIYNNLAGGIVNYIGNGADAHINFIAHNTVYFSSAQGRYGVGLHSGAHDNTVGNNILVTADNIHWAIDLGTSGTGNVVDYNAVYTPGGTYFTTDGNDGLTNTQWISAGYGSHSVILPDPTSVFKNVGNNDYSEASGAPTIKAGNIVYSTIDGTVISDFYGTPRTAGNIDMGAYQFGSMPSGSGGSSGVTVGQTGSTSSSSSDASFCSPAWLLAVLLRSE